jgi:protein-S-isoprenylcysteine O-methyltransferase Ste14
LIALVGVWFAPGHRATSQERAAGGFGPYAHTRNPLYFGSFLIAAGFAVAAHWALLLVVIAFWVFVYAPTMERERANISGRFPEAYDAIRDNVPAFVPRVTRGRASGHVSGFSFAST